MARPSLVGIDPPMDAPSLEMHVRRLMQLAWSLAFLMTLSNAGGAAAATPENTLIIELATGKVTVELLPDVAPQHVARIKELARAHFYDGIVFHRVIPGFMAQTGDPDGTGSGGSDKPNLKAEFSKAPFERGTLGMARTANPNSANSQFFICFDRAPWLDGQYTVFGKVTDGMDLVDKIAKGEPPRNPDKMVKVYLAADGG